MEMDDEIFVPPAPLDTTIDEDYPVPPPPSEDMMLVSNLPRIPPYPFLLLHTCVK